MGPLEITILLVFGGIVVLGIAVIRQVNKVADPGKGFARAGIIGSFGKLSAGWKILAALFMLAVVSLTCSMLSF